MYGGQFPWVDVDYYLLVDNGMSPLQWVQGMTQMALLSQRIAFGADGRFYCPDDGRVLFPIAGVDLRWRCEGMHIIIDFFHHGIPLYWRRDVLQTAGSHASDADIQAPNLVGLGYVASYSFSYRFIKASSDGKLLQPRADARTREPFCSNSVFGLWNCSAMWKKEHCCDDESCESLIDDSSKKVLETTPSGFFSCDLGILPCKPPCSHAPHDPWSSSSSPTRPNAEGGELRVDVASDQTQPDCEKVAMDALSEHEKVKLQELELRLAQKPMPSITPHQQEPHTLRLLRFLRDERFDVEKALDRMHANARWWVEYGMEGFVEDDEFDEQGPCFVCGKDRWGQPTLVCRPRVHSAKTEQDSVIAVRRSVYTIQRCIERLPLGCEKFSLIYDVDGVQFANMDINFTRMLLDIVQKQYPERMHRVFVINSNWVAMALWSTLSPLLDPVQREKIVFCSADFRKELSTIVSDSHPYVNYAIEAQTLKKGQSHHLPLPKASPYVAGWQHARVIEVEHVCDEVMLVTSRCSGTEPTMLSIVNGVAAKAQRGHFLRRLISSNFFQQFACCR